MFQLDPYQVTTDETLEPLEKFPYVFKFFNTEDEEVNLVEDIILARFSLIANEVLSNSEPSPEEDKKFEELLEKLMELFQVAYPDCNPETIGLLLTSPPKEVEYKKSYVIVSGSLDNPLKAPIRGISADFYPRF